MFTHVLIPSPSSDDREPIATTPTHEADQGHMSGAEEAPPILNPTPPAVVPSPADGAKEATEQDVDILGGDVGEGLDDSVVSSENQASERPGSVSIDPSYNPSGEELLYEGDVEAEAPVVKEKEGGASQDEGFMINVHETGMELDMAESLPHSHSKSGTATGENGSKHSSSPHWRSGEGGGKATPSSSSKSASDSKRSSSKDVDRFVLYRPLPLPPQVPYPYPLPPQVPPTCATGAPLIPPSQVLPLSHYR